MFVSKRGNVWSYTIEISRDPETGKRVRKTKSGFVTKTDAMRAAEKEIESRSITDQKN